jgi:glycosyltransferase involved in cell wall biosynthesis
VVGTDVDGFPDTLADGRGILVAPEDPGALARALEDILSGRRRPDIAAARAWARQFDAERVTTLYQHCYHELRRAVTPSP